MVLWVLNVMERRRLGKLNMNYLRGALGPIVMDWIRNNAAKKKRLAGAS